LTDSKGGDIALALSDRVRQAAARGERLRIVGGGTKTFLGRAVTAPDLELSAHRGVVAYEPTELVVTARAGTPLHEVEALLAQRGQMFAFEPPSFGDGGTIGGMVAAGLSGPRRPFAGAVRDYVLGVRVLDGRGRSLRLGGTVFKNVAGFDGFRLMAGAHGCLGAILEVSLRVAPRPRAERTLVFEEPWSAAQTRLAALVRRPLPLTGAMHDGERLFLRLSGGEAAVSEAADALGGEAASMAIWDEVRHMRLPILSAPRLWRLSVPRGAQLTALEGRRLYDWAGAQVWVDTEAPAQVVRAAAQAVGGHATLFRGAAPGEAVFTPLAPPLLALHQRIKAALDPRGVFNPGRMYEDL
jgi:glycolate oxidase FAD binding subunit